jgi:NAD(P)-dependent dehydrogenase (short-subunit alcohol dehydrogenase family)
MFNPVELSNRRYLISGAASGIGRATAIYLSKLGANLLLVDINEEQLKVTQDLCLSHSSVLVVLSIDVTDYDAMRIGIMTDVESNGKLHGLVHCAGLPYIAPLKMISKDKVMKVYQVNTYAGLEMAKIFISKNVYAGENGSIVFISSIYGIVGSIANVGYSMSKGAIQSATKALAIELAPKKIRVNCIAPGFIKTEMRNHINHNFDIDHDNNIESLHPLGWGNPNDIAAGIAYLFSDMSRWVTGTIMNIDGGFTAQ